MKTKQNQKQIYEKSKPIIEIMLTFTIIIFIVYIGMIVWNIQLEGEMKYIQWCQQAYNMTEKECSDRLMYINTTYGVPLLSFILLSVILIAYWFRPHVRDI